MLDGRGTAYADGTPLRRCFGTWFFGNGVLRPKWVPASTGSDWVLSEQLAPMPTDAVLIGATTHAERIRRMALAFFGWWDQLGDGFDHLRIDRRHLPQVDAWLAEVARRHRDLAEAAFAGADPSRVDLLVALTTVDAWRALRDAGMDSRRAAAQVSQLFAHSSGTGKAVH